MSSLRDDVQKCLVSEETSDGEASCRFQFHPEQQVFSGHFPSYPLVPGIFLIETARIACERLSGRCLRVAEMNNVKFTLEVRPGDTVETRASLTRVAQSEDRWSCKATISTETGQAAKLRLQFVEALTSE